MYKIRYFCLFGQGFWGGVNFENSENQISGKRRGGKAAKRDEAAAKSNTEKGHRMLPPLLPDGGGGHPDWYFADRSGKQYDAGMAK